MVDDLRRLAVIALDFAADQEVEFLIGAAQLDVALQRHRIVALRQRIEQFVHRDRRPSLIALGEIVALEDPRHRVRGAEADDVFETAVVPAIRC